jgi:hypothetical protein
VHHGGDPEQMFDNKTAQDYWAGPMQKDNGSAYREETYKNWQENSQALLKQTDEHDACIRALRKYPKGIDSSGTRPIECWSEDAAYKLNNLLGELYTNASHREDRLREHPEEQKVIQVHGLPYCAGLK